MKPQNSTPQDTAGPPPHRKDDDPGISDRLKSLWTRVQQGFQAEPIETEAAKEVIIQQVLTTLAHASFSTADPTEVFNLILRQMQKIVAFDAAAIFLTEGETLRAKTWFGRASELPINPVIALQGDNPAAQAFRTQQPTYISDSGTTPETQSPAANLPWRSWLGMPLTSKGERLGVLMLFGERPQQFSDTDRRWARAITEYIIAALRNAHFSEWAQRGAARQSFLLEAARTLSATLNSEEVLQQLLNLTLKYFQPAAVSIA
ncbi:MAG: GAF domain-containing protein, partial [Anaerolineae bacterium]|nr:GAF domain-containing protein [Anaerolineae bacterium]